MPLARFYCGAFNTGDMKIHVIGGNGGTILDHHVYDLELDEWSESAPLPNNFVYDNWLACAVDPYTQRILCFPRKSPYLLSYLYYNCDIMGVKITRSDARRKMVEINVSVCVCDDFVSQASWAESCTASWTVSVCACEEYGREGEVATG